MTQLFTLETYGTVAQESTLEGHLIATAKRWISGQGNVKPTSLQSMILLLVNEHKWFTKDNPKQKPVDVWLADDHPAIYFRPSGRTTASARITANVII